MVTRPLGPTPMSTISCAICAARSQIANPLHHATTLMPITCSSKHIAGLAVALRSDPPAQETRLTNGNGAIVAPRAVRPKHPDASDTSRSPSYPAVRDLRRPHPVTPADRPRRSSHLTSVTTCGHQTAPRVAQPLALRPMGHQPSRLRRSSRLTQCRRRAA